MMETIRAQDILSSQHALITAKPTRKPRIKTKYRKWSNEENARLKQLLLGGMKFQDIHRDPAFYQIPQPALRSHIHQLVRSDPELSLTATGKPVEALVPHRMSPYKSKLPPGEVTKMINNYLSSHPESDPSQAKSNDKMDIAEMPESNDSDTDMSETDSSSGEEEEEVDFRTKPAARIVSVSNAARVAPLNLIHPAPTAAAPTDFFPSSSAAVPTPPAAAVPTPSAPAPTPVMTKAMASQLQELVSKAARAPVATPSPDSDRPAQLDRPSARRRRRSSGPSVPPPPPVSAPSAVSATEPKPLIVLQRSAPVNAPGNSSVNLGHQNAVSTPSKVLATLPASQPSFVGPRPDVQQAVNPPKITEIPPPTAKDMPVNAAVVNALANAVNNAVNSQNGNSTETPASPFYRVIEIPETQQVVVVVFRLPGLQYLVHSLGEYIKITAEAPLPLEESYEIATKLEIPLNLLQMHSKEKWNREELVKLRRPISRIPAKAVKTKNADVFVYNQS
eukprot:TRINITY_DN5430_c0_g1_i1.p1 TRINITY_DN5430_c0_g1~~TRINITY_DN5430_c0_g1_i1.p1  ORF type:complete len:505 (+),score=119.77 TRINITY_DN5430_c0_g1_i1:126-1640(+)